MSYPIAIVSDCGGQAMSRMMTRYLALFSNAACVGYESSSLVEASGNLVDALDALMGHEGAVVCNSAPRRDALGTNGSAIVYGTVGKVTVVSTVGVLGFLKRLVPDFTARALDMDAFMRMKCGNKSLTTHNFRGLQVIPFVLQFLKIGHDLSKVSTPHDKFPTMEPCVWLIDTIEGRPTNLKLSILRSEALWFVPGNAVWISLGETDPKELRCYERLTHIPEGGIGIYEGSSGLGDDRFLEIAVMGGSAAETLGIPTLFYTEHPQITIMKG